MKNRITILVGVSGSGKSTYAHQEWSKDPKNTVVVNRDKIRELLFGYTEGTVNQYYERDDIFSMEKLVTRYEDTLINETIQMGKNVIVDSTNLKRGYIERFRYWNVPTCYKLFPVTLKEAEIRDMSRDRRVGAKVIQKQYNSFVNLFNSLQKDPIKFEVVEFENNPDKREAVIFDIDGTIAHKGKRSPYDWKSVGLDTLDRPTAEVMDMIGASGAKVIVCTGRDGICRYETEKWLKQHSLPYHEIYIRKEKDMRPDWIVKEEMWRKIAKDHYIVGMFDDRLQVVRRARALGLKVFNVEYNNF